MVIMPGQRVAILWPWKQKPCTKGGDAGTNSVNEDVLSIYPVASMEEQQGFILMGFKF